VFDVLSRHMQQGQLTKVRQALPEGLRAAWGGLDGSLRAPRGGDASGAIV